MTMRVAFLGLGVMGYPMAGHLKHAGHDVVVYNRTKNALGAGWTNRAVKALRRLQMRPTAPISSWPVWGAMPIFAA